MSRKTSTISLSELLALLRESGFTVELKKESALLAQSNKPKVRARATTTTIKGLIVPDRNVIMINRDLSVDERVVTAIHELIHLHSPELSEEVTEQEAQRLFGELSQRDLGYLEFLVS